MAVKLGVCLLLLLELLELTAAQETTKYFEIGGSLKLRPASSSEPITGITWKHKGNLVAEWIQDKVDLEYLGDMKDRLELNLTTGELTVKNTIKADDGLFTVEINNRVLPGGFRAVGVRKLDSLTVIVRPLTCSSQSTECSLVCGDDLKDIEPAKYFWKKGDTAVFEEGEKSLLISNNEETLKIKIFSCKATNPVSEKESSPEKNPFTVDHPNSQGVVIPIAVVVSLLFVAGLFIAYLLIKRPPWIQRLPCFPCVNANPTEEPTENGGKADNAMPLTGPESNSPEPV